MYAILSHGGRQYRVSAGDRLVVDRLDAEVGSVVALEPVLLTGGDGKTALGKDLDGLRVAVTVIAHRRGEKLRIFKYKAKKRSRKVAGYRSDLTELRVESIVAKGAALPRASTATAARSEGRGAKESDAPAPRAARSTGARAAAPKATEAKAPAAQAPGTATAKPAAGAAKRASPASAKRASPASAKPKAPGAAAKTDTKAAAPAKPRTKAAPKRASKEKSDGA